MRLNQNRRARGIASARLFYLQPLFSIIFVATFSWQNYARSTNTPSFRTTTSSHQLAFKNSYVGDQRTARIPFQFVGRLIVMQAFINQEEGKFIFDTGASGLLLNQQYQNQESIASNELTYSSTGELPPSQSTRLDSFKLNHLFFEGLKATLVDLSNLEQSRNEKITGIVGYSVFKDFEVFIDYQFRQLILTRLDKKGKRLDKRGILEIPIDSLSFNLFKHAIVIKGYIGLEELKFNLDTGAEINLLDSRLPMSILENFEIIRRVTMIGVGNKKVEVLAGKFDGLVCGPGRPYAMRTLLANTDYIRKATNVRVDGVLGYEFLYLKRISINYKTKKIYFYAFKEFKP